MTGRKTPVEIDDEALAAAAKVLGTTTTKDTVNAALREVSQRFLRLRALEQLGERGEHRSAGPVDLLIAATAERSGLIVLCDDHDFETVSAVTGQPVRRVTSM